MSRSKKPINGAEAGAKSGGREPTKQRVLRIALEKIVALDFQKTERGGDDFYSGAPRFVTAWLTAKSALDRFARTGGTSE